MEESHYKIEVENDHLRRICGASTVHAISELIWNSLDAEATKVQVTAVPGELDSSTVIVRDNGHGIPFADAKHLFVKLGGSWKGAAIKSKQLNRALHGKEGKGRFKALALGRVVEWVVSYRTGGELRQYTITMLADDPKDVRITAETIVSDGESGVEVRISEVNQRMTTLESDDMAQEFAEIFAPYLTDYADVQVTIYGAVLDPARSIASRKEFPLADIVVSEDEKYPATLHVVEWYRSTQQRTLYLCSTAGMPLKRVATRFHTPDFNFSAYLRSEYNEKLRETDEALDLAEMHAPLIKVRDEALDHIKAYAHSRSSEKAREVVADWKRENVYPYEGEANDPVENMERQVFDMVALTVRKHVSELSEGSKKSKALQLQLLRKAIERGPEELQPLLLNVLQLPIKDQKELTSLLKEVSLVAMMRATRVVTDRMKFVTGLRHMLFDKGLKELLLERTQLHRMLAENTWVFGEEFNMSVDDESLTIVLEQHRKLLGDPIVVDRPVKTVEGKKGIIDLMFSRSVKGNRLNDLEHLVVELKRPTVKVGPKELTQIETYAAAVAKDERFRSLDTRWTFWVLSNDMDGHAEMRANQSGQPRGRTFVSDNPRISIWVKTWASVLQENEDRLRFYQDNLNYKATKSQAVEHVRETYQRFLSKMDAAMRRASGGDESASGESGTESVG